MVTSAAITAAMTNLSMPLASRRVAVIGAGAAGLAAARELHLEGHKVVVFEKSSQVGGIWVYDPSVDSDPTGVDPGRTVVHSSMYNSLRTNLPREIMGFKEFPFVPRKGNSVDPRRFPSHKEVLVYLEDFATEFGIGEMVRFESEVVKVGLENGSQSQNWRVKIRNKRGFEDEVHDAVVVCNGHYTEPRVAEINGINSWPGKQMHSHNYRTPEPFRDQVVVVIGSSTSAVDISREIAGVAKEVHVASRSVANNTHEQQPGYNNMWLHSMIERANEDGSVLLRNGRVVSADIILHCTGYKYHFPFLETGGIVTVDDNRVGPLYKHVFPPALAPWLSFVGLPWKVIAFPRFELQSKWIAGVLSGRVVLPSQEEMMEDVNSFYAALEVSDVPNRYTHRMDNQFEYNNWLADQCGCLGVEGWREQMYYVARKNKCTRPETYREEWDDDQLVMEAYTDFTKYTNSCV